jgi:ADP-ribose pyrophosphatase YjhB (NUDIX family)
MKYCTHCGQKLVRQIPADESVVRAVCSACDAVHYENPKIITACIVNWQGQVLLCRRAIEPRVGSWTLPAGYMELNETMEQAALREAREETGANIRLDALYSVFDIEHINQVYITYRGTMTSADIVVGSECLEVRLFDPEDIPWDNLFYPAIEDLLRRYRDDLARGSFSLYTGTSVTGKVARIERDEG